MDPGFSLGVGVPLEAAKVHRVGRLRALDGAPKLIEGLWRRRDVVRVVLILIVVGHGWTVARRRSTVLVRLKSRWIAHRHRAPNHPGFWAPPGHRGQLPPRIARAGCSAGLLCPRGAGSPSARARNAKKPRSARGQPGRGVVPGGTRREALSCPISEQQGKLEQEPLPIRGELRRRLDQVAEALL